MFFLLAMKDPEYINSKVQSVSLLSPVISINSVSNWSLKLLIKSLGYFFKLVPPFQLLDIPKSFIIKYIPIPANLVQILLGYLTGQNSNAINWDSSRVKELVNTFGWTSS